MSSARKIRTWRAALLLTLLVLVQACAGGVPGGSPRVGPPGRAGLPPPRTLSNCSGDRFRVDLLDAIDALPEDTLDAQREQLRDWIWTVTLGRIAHRSGADEVLSSVADEPLVRDDALAHVLHMQVGPTRGATTKSGGAIVLVEAADAETLSAEVLEAIDRESLHLGRTPAEAQVYQYAFQPELGLAEVCAMRPLARAEIEGAARGYRSTAVRTAAELEKFLEGGVDLLSAQCTASGLEVTGRKRPRSAGARFTTEHVAALTQARGGRFIPPARFGASLDNFRPSDQAKLKQEGQQIDALLKLPPERLTNSGRVLLAWRRQNPGVPGHDLLISRQLQDEFDGRPGFSLDPISSAGSATHLLDQLIKPLPDIARFSGLLRGSGFPELADAIQDVASSTNEPFAKELKAALVEVRSKLQKASPEEVEAILFAKLPDSLGNSLASSVLRVVWRESGQQCARYDGPLAGTETGMTFFYTDLLAKLWLMDWRGAAPEGVIEGFESILHQDRTTASCEAGEKDRSNTRIWFGVREESFSREASGAVRFGPTSARIFAKGSPPGERKEESEPSADSSRFVAWWDQHFPQIAAWEPQYEVLNQLMKWSVVVQSGILAGDEQCLAILDRVAVKADHRIDQWVARRSELRWRGPVSLLPPAKGRTDDGRECMELFESERFSACGSDARSISGGVSAATPEMVTAKLPRSAETPAHLGRFGAEAKPAAGAARVEFETIRGSGGELKNVTIEGRPTKVDFSADVDTKASQRGAASSWDTGVPVKRVEKTLELQGGRLVGRERINGLVSAELTAADIAAADVRPSIKPSTVGEAKAAGQKVAKSMALEGVDLRAAGEKLASHREVKILDDGSIAVRIDDGSGGKVWAIMESSGGIRGPPPGSKASFRVGIPDGGPHRPGSARASQEAAVHVSILEDPQATAHLNAKKAKPLQPSNAAPDAAPGKADADDFDRALANGDHAAAAKILDGERGQTVSPARLQARREQVKRHAVQLERQGADRSALDAIEMRLAFEERRALTPSRQGERVRAAAGKDAAVYAPPSYPRVAELPPAVHPPGKALLPDEQWVTRVIDDASPDTLPPKVTARGVEYQQRAAGKATPLSYGSVGPASRLLLGYQRPILLVTRCDDRNPELPPCHERPSAEDIERYKAAMGCDTDGDRQFSTPEERACLDALRAKQRAPAPPPPRP